MLLLSLTSKQPKCDIGAVGDRCDRHDTDEVECLPNSSHYDTDENSGISLHETDRHLITNQRQQNSGNSSSSRCSNNDRNNSSSLLHDALMVNGSFTSDIIENSSKSSDSDDSISVPNPIDFLDRFEDHSTAIKLGPVILKDSPSKDVKYTYHLKKSRAGNIANAVLAANPLRRIRTVPLGRGYEFHKRALLKYKELYGDIMVRHKFIIPWIDIWQEEMWGLKLGQLVCIQIRNQEKYKEQKEDLIRIGFNYHRQKISAHGFEKIRSALLIFKQINNHTLVPNKYVIPEATAEWPEKYWGMKLHSVLQDIKRGHAYTDENRQELLDIGL